LKDYKSGMHQQRLS